MLTLESPLLERRLAAEATQRGLTPSDYAVRLLEGLLAPEHTTEAAERARLAAIDELMGFGIGAGFSTADLQRDREEESNQEEESYQRLFEGKEGKRAA